MTTVLFQSEEEDIQKWEWLWWHCSSEKHFPSAIPTSWTMPALKRFNAFLQQQEKNVQPKENAAASKTG